MRINLAWIVGAALLFVGGFSVDTFAADASDIAVIVAIVAGLAGAAFFSSHESMTWRLSFRGLTLVDVALISVFFAGMIALAWSRLSNDLWSDALYHASLATRPAQLLLFFVQEISPETWSWLANVKAATAISSSVSPSLFASLVCSRAEGGC